MAEMVIPGTYIDVRAEGLISAGRISSGIVGVVGTAASGPVNTPVTLASLSNARDVFGPPDPFTRPQDGANALTLVRALELLYANGASSVIAVRVAGASQAKATFAVLDGDGRTVATLAAKTPGAWANNLQVLVDPALDDAFVSGESLTATFTRLAYKGVTPSPRNQIRLYRGTTKQSRTLDIVYKRTVVDEDVSAGANGRFFLANKPVENVPQVNHLTVIDAATGNTIREYGDGRILYGAGTPPNPDELRINDVTGEITFAATQVPTAGQTITATYGVGHANPTSSQVSMTTWDGSLTFAAGEAPAQANGDRVDAAYLVDSNLCAQVTLRYLNTTERYTVPDGRMLAALIAARPTALVTAVADAANGDHTPATGVSVYMGTGSNTPGDNGAAAGSDEYAGGLESLSNLLVNIVVLAGQDARQMGAVLLGHLNSTAETDLERIGVIGAAGQSVVDYLSHDMASDRVVLVAPGIALSDGTVLPATYMAAAVAGLISSLPAQTSLTNKPVTIAGLAIRANRGEQEQLIRKNVLAVISKQGFRVLKSITTAGEGDPFSQITTRRIVDYAKYGVRSAANPYIGRLNNPRVRSALKATLDGFLTRMVEDEALTRYDLDVTATRAQEIAGEVSVTMTLQPTFSIDFIRVVMNLH